MARFIPGIGLCLFLLTPIDMAKAQTPNGCGLEYFNGKYYAAKPSTLEKPGAVLKLSTGSSKEQCCIDCQTYFSGCKAWSYQRFFRTCNLFAESQMVNLELKSSFLWESGTVNPKTSSYTCPNNCPLCDNMFDSDVLSKISNLDRNSDAGKAQMAAVVSSLYKKYSDDMTTYALMKIFESDDNWACSRNHLREVLSCTSKYSSEIITGLDNLLKAVGSVSFAGKVAANGLAQALINKAQTPVLKAALKKYRSYFARYSTSAIGDYLGKLGTYNKCTFLALGCCHNPLLELNTPNNIIEFCQGFDDLPTGFCFL